LQQQRGRRRTSPLVVVAAAPAPVPATTTTAAAEKEAYERGYAAGLLASQQQPPPPPLARSAAKGVSWRVFSAAITLSLAVLIFGKDAFEEAGGAFAVGKFAAAEFCVKLATYVAHERMWSWIDRRR
jgi:hypothetical protein